VEWCFDQLGVDRICETTARDNDRSIRLLSRLGFHQLGEVTSHRPDGTTRPSIYWEMERRERYAARAAKRAAPQAESVSANFS
jgi:RimJ/RimL family protein N-acetyltransferase